MARLILYQQSYFVNTYGTWQSWLLEIAAVLSLRTEKSRFKYGFFNNGAVSEQMGVI